VKLHRSFNEHKMPTDIKISKSIPHADAFVLSVLSGVPAGHPRRVLYKKLDLASKLGRQGMSIARRLLHEGHAAPRTARTTSAVVLGR